ncbi:MAG: hypothetical protein EZS28_034562 [Streblomastix strix]|uniref:Right handed beta helix domain-containing protein n=1 Tax=Streblomastix strix TaxID=222440 RepID=A0A5J4UJ38_9EUKA|nr:MAG: hypothetical protein EZS28_034562 [Streblomastix strix]
MILARETCRQRSSTLLVYFGSTMLIMMFYIASSYVNITEDVIQNITGDTFVGDRLECKNNEGNGGVANYYLTDGGYASVRQSTFTKCESRYNGGAFSISINFGSIFELIGLCYFQECKSTSSTSPGSFGGGGAIYASIIQPNSKFIIKDGVIFEYCSSHYQGGCLYLLADLDGYVDINNASLSYCSANEGGAIYSYSGIRSKQVLNKIRIENCESKSGGGLFADIRIGGSVILDEQCEIINCSGSEGNGGGIYANINFTPQQCIFKINDAIIQYCKARFNSSLVYPTGYGGGLFICGSGNYNASTNYLDFHGLKIFNNSADNKGQSMYIAIPKVAEWCQSGILGEYVKGNYNNKNSSLDDLYGIPIDLTQFNASS